MEQPDTPPDPPRELSQSIDTGAVSWAVGDPDDVLEHAPPSAPADSSDIVPNRHSASAEAASVRWHEEHPDEDQ
jgi:hypothetical protein